jgi:hypothetical protein
MEGQFRTEDSHGNTNMPDVEHRPRPAPVQKLPAFLMSLYPSICMPPGCSRPSHCAASIAATETRRVGRLGSLPSSRSLQRLFH